MESSSEVMNLKTLDKETGSEDEKFYKPLCITGYLTPLQRKKLREKRSHNRANSFETKNSAVSLKPRVIKRKNIQNKKKEQIKKIKSKECVSQIQCSAAKIFKTTDFYEKDKKFFKTSSSDRLGKAHFCMPLVFKRNVFLAIDKSVKDNLCYSKKKFILTDRTNNSESFLNDVDEDLQGEISSEMDLKKEKSVFDFDWPSDEILLKRQEKARADVKKQKVNKESKPKQKDTENKVHGVDKPTKLYPIFYVANKKQSKEVTAVNATPLNTTLIEYPSSTHRGSTKCITAHSKSPEGPTRKKTTSNKRMKKESANGGEQMIIDAGQKEIGAKVCHTCNMVYTIGLEEDEQLHLNYHTMYLINLKFLGWKEENVIGEYSDGRVILIRRNDNGFKLKKIEDVLVIVNRDLGCASSTFICKPDAIFILFISNSKQVAGCVVAEPVSSAQRVLLDESGLMSKDSSASQGKDIWKMGRWCLSTETVPAVCGINRVWVAHDYRHQKVASRMIDCLRCNFIHGHIIGIRELAFTDPSLDGREFAAAYTGTNNFLVYK